MSFENSSEQMDNEQATLTAFENILPDNPPPPNQPQVKAEAEDETDLVEAEAGDPEEVALDLDGEKYTKTQLKELIAQKNTIEQQKSAIERNAEESAKTMEAAKAERDYYAAKLSAETKKIQDNLAEFDKVDWIRLSQTDMASYVKYKEMHEQEKRNLQAVLDERQNFFKFVETRLAEEHYKSAIRATNELKKTFKNWNDQTYYALVDYGVTKGYDKHFLLQSTDPSIFKMLHQQKTFEKASGKFQEPKNIVNIGVNNRNTHKKTSALDTLKKTGDHRDAVAAFESMLG